MYRNTTLVPAGILRACVCIGAVLLSACSQDKGTITWHLLPEDTGLMDNICISVAKSSDGLGCRSVPMVAEILRALPGRTGVSVLMEQTTAHADRFEPLENRGIVTYTPQDTPVPLWVQDPFLVLTDGCGDSMLLAPSEAGNTVNSGIVALIAKQMGWKWRVSSTAFEGGNVVAGSRHVFVGRDTVRRNATMLRCPEANVEVALARELGAPVIVLGSSPQKIPHIDLILAPIGPRQVVLADSSWGARIAAEALRRDPVAVTKFEEKCEAASQVDCGDFGDADPAGRGSHDRYRVVGQTTGAIESSTALAPHFEELAESLRLAGYKVERVPSVFFKAEHEPHRANQGVRQDHAALPAYPCLT